MWAVLKWLDGADSAQTDLGDTPLHLAASHGNAQVFSLSRPEQYVWPSCSLVLAGLACAGLHADF